MKRLLFLVFIVISHVSVYAQDGNYYLETAYKLLNQGDIEKAQKAYSTFCELSSQRDLILEQKMNDAKKK